MREKIAEHALQIREHVVVPVAHNDHALLSKPSRSAIVGLLAIFRMLAAVDFDREMEPRAIEIDGVGSARMLLPEGKAIELIAAKRMPQASFRTCHVGAERSRPSGHGFCAGKAWPPPPPPPGGPPPSWGGWGCSPFPPPARSPPSAGPPSSCGAARSHTLGASRPPAGPAS